MKDGGPGGRAAEDMVEGSALPEAKKSVPIPTGYSLHEHCSF